MSRRKKRRMKIKKILILLIIISAMTIGIIYVLKNKKKPEQKEIEVVDSIDDFGYELNDNETKYYNNLFTSLKELLKTEDYSEEEYAQIISKLFLTDFFDLDNKIMKSDIGGTQFVYESYRQDFESGAKTSIYKYVESNVYGDRKQELPKVKEVKIEKTSSDQFKYNDTVDSKAYYITATIEYEKNLGYPTEVQLVLIHNNERLEIAKLETKN